MESRKFKICRLCLCENECFINIFVFNDWQGYVAAEVISDFLRFQVSEFDRYPHVVCPKCLMSLTEFKKFKERSQKSKTKYDDMVASSEAIIDPKEMAMLKQDILENDSTSADGSEDKIGNNNVGSVESNNLKREVLSVNLDDNTQDVGDGGKNLESSERDPLGESLSHAMLKQDILENDSTSADGSEDKIGNNNVGSVESNNLKREVLSVNLDDNTQDVGDGGKNLESSERDPLGESLSHEDREWRPAPFAGRKDRFQCQTCKKVLKTKNGLRSHLAAHGIGTFHKCTVCSKIFGSKAGLVNHACIHMGEKLFICDE